MKVRFKDISTCFSASVQPKLKPLPLEQQRGIGRIVGGTDAEKGEFPFQVRIDCRRILTSATHLYF
jgi:hypothetical protein